MSLQLAVVIPGPTEKKKIDKTAAQIAKTPAFLEKLISRPEFSFLLEDDKFNPYYLQALEKSKTELSSSSSAAVINNNTDAAASTDSSINKNNNSVGANTRNNISSSSGAAIATSSTAFSTTLQSSSSTTAQDFLLRDTLPDDFSIPVTASGISALEIDLIQLAAQHAAVYGDLFVQTVLARSAAKQRSLEFLNPDHSHHPIFVKIRDSYIKILGALATELMPEEAAIIAGSRAVTDVPPAHVTRGQNDLVTRLELLAGEVKENNKGAQDNANRDAESIRRGREAFLIECNAKKSFMVQEDTKRRNAQMSDGELMQRLNWEQFVVKGSFSFADLKLRQ